LHAPIEKSVLYSLSTQKAWSNATKKLLPHFAYNFNDCIKNFNEENFSHENVYLIGGI
jgi:hypothetical protein